MTNQRKVAPRVFVPIFLVFMGIVAFSNAASKPSFEALRAVDVVRLIGAGMCFGAAVVSLVVFLRDRSSN